MNDITMWILSWSIEQKRLTDSWVDIAPVVTDFADQEYRDTVARENNLLTANAQREHQQYSILYRDPMTGNPVQPVYANPIFHDPAALLTMDHCNTDYVRPAHQRRFPIADHLMTLIFLANSDLSEQQRERLTSHLALRGIMMPDYTLELKFTPFRTRFTSTKTGISDPSIRSGGLERSSKHRSFFLFGLESSTAKKDIGPRSERMKKLTDFCQQKMTPFGPYVRSQVNGIQPM
jgi:hypothetical protein